MIWTAKQASAVDSAAAKANADEVHSAVLNIPGRVESRGNRSEGGFSAGCSFSACIWYAATRDADLRHDKQVVPVIFVELKSRGADFEIVRIEPREAAPK